MQSSHMMPIRRPHNQPIRNPHLESFKKAKSGKNSVWTKKKKVIAIVVLLILTYVFVKAFS